LIPSLDGATLYQTYCAVCHGKTADGDGPTASVLKAHVPNLTEIAKRNGGVFPFARVQKIIDGTESAGLRHGTREMPIWGPIFSRVADDRDYGPNISRASKGRALAGSSPLNNDSLQRAANWAKTG
jgi:hypothetical protein